MRKYAGGLGRQGCSHLNFLDSHSADKQHIACCPLQRHTSIGEAQSQFIISLHLLVSKLRLLMRAEEEPQLWLASLMYA